MSQSSGFRERCTWACLWGARTLWGRVLHGCGGQSMAGRHHLLLLAPGIELGGRSGGGRHSRRLLRGGLVGHRVGCVIGGGVGYLSPRGGGGGGFPWRSTARGWPSASRSTVIRVRLPLAAGSLSFLARAPLAVGDRDVAACSRRGGGLSARAPASCRSAAASISCWIRLVM